MGQVIDLEIIKIIASDIAKDLGIDHPVFAEKFANAVYNKTFGIPVEEVMIPCVAENDIEIPAYQSELASGMDIKANLSNITTEKDLKGEDFDFTNLGEKEIILYTGGRVVIPTGIKMAIPKGYEIQVRPRSGLAAKNGISLVNSPGTIDADYRGELGVILINTSKRQFVIKHGDRIAQLVLAKVEKAHLMVVSKLDDTVRGEGGYGSSGK